MYDRHIDHTANMRQPGIRNCLVRSALAIAALLSLCTPAVANNVGPLNLPSWEVMEFEKQAFWATAKSRLELEPLTDSSDRWRLVVASSIPRNSEYVTVMLNAANGRMKKKDRLSEGTVEKRLKSYTFMPQYIKRERRDPKRGTDAAPVEWPLSSTHHVDYPDTRGETLITDAYMLPILAGQLLQEGVGATMEVLVHTDNNFYRVRMTCGNGVPVEADYAVSGGDSVQARKETMGVALHVQPEGTLPDKDDFSFLGLSGEIILLFDRDNDLLLQVRGDAPRIGTTEINLKSVTMRSHNSEE